jgi:hypothetical protein
MMANLIKWITDEANGESIEAVVIGEMGWEDYVSDRVPNYDQQPRGQVIDWETAKQYLDYDFYDGYGAPECNAIYVWTATKVMFIDQYDGSTSIHSVPRMPSPCLPKMPGG